MMSGPALFRATTHCSRGSWESSTGLISKLHIISAAQVSNYEVSNLALAYSYRGHMSDVDSKNIPVVRNTVCLDLVFRDNYYKIQQTNLVLINTCKV